MGSHNEENVRLGHSLRSFINIFSKYKLYIAITMFFVFIIEGALIVDKFILKFFVDAATSYATGVTGKDAFYATIVMLFLLLIGIVLVRTIGRWILTHRGNVVGSSMAYDLKLLMFKHVLQLPTSFHANHKTGTMISRLMRAGGSIEAILDVFVYSLVPIVIQIITVVGSLLFLNLSSAIIVILYVFAFLGYSYFIQMKQLKPQVDYNNAEDVEKGFVSDSFTNIESIKLYGKEEYMSLKFSELVGNTKQKLMIFWGWWRWSEAGLIGITGLAILAVAFTTGYQFYSGSMELGTLVFTYTVVLSMAGPLQSFQWGMRGLYRGLGDFESLRQYLDEKNDIVDKPNAKDMKISKGKISFEKVVFHYSKKQVFEEMNLEVPSQKTVALVGKSGSGKSTLVKLLFRLYETESGSINIDGISIKDVKQQTLRSSMSVVPQECILFDDSLYNNILFANPNATREQVMKALSLAQLDDVISQMPQKENTIVGERGVKLSGGEKQRVSIARAILADKRILVLDEATSALDSETEFAIKKALAILMKGRTSIIIAHRLSTIMNADKIVVLRAGRIMQEGTHKQLISRDGEYKRLWNLQKGGYIR